MLTKKEEKIEVYLVKAWNLFNKVPRQHPDELRDFCDGIHKCQYIMGMRRARKYFPKEYPIKIKC